MAAAVVYLEIMEEQAKKDADKTRGALIGKIAQKGRSMLLWAAGEDNEFGRMVERAWKEHIQAEDQKGV